MSPIDRIVHWKDEDNQLWRAGLLAAGRNRLAALTDGQRVLLVLCTIGAAGVLVLLAR
jgi:hypothetical protein